MPDNVNLPRVEYRKILYTTDLSEGGRHAFPYAASIAHRYGADLTVFHVVESQEFEKFLVGYLDESLWDEIKTRNLQEARELLVNRKRGDAQLKESVDQFLKDSLSDDTAKPYVTYDIVVEMGDPVEKIIEHADSGGYDMVVIGKHGRRPLKDTLMGDTARRVTRRCKVPVLVVHVPDGGGDD